MGFASVKHHLLFGICLRFPESSRIGSRSSTSRDELSIDVLLSVADACISDYSSLVFRVLAL